MPAKGRYMAHTDVPGVQRTLALIRPDALADKKGMQALTMNAAKIHIM